MVDLDVSEAGEDDEEAEDEVNKMVPARGRRPKKGNKSKGKGKRNPQRQNAGINSDEIGDDCGRDSDMLETDGSDDGEDLVDFIVSDNHVTSSMREPRSTSLTTASSTPSAPDRTEKPFFVPTQFAATQDSEGMPDIDALVGIKAGGDGGTRRTIRGRRAVIDDSDSDF